MAIADYDPLFQPIRGKILGTVMQTGRNAPVIKSIDNNHGQQLRALQNSKAQLQHAAALWRELAPADQIIWDAKRPDFPTVDRYGNPVLSSAYSLYLRAIAHLPNDRQVFLTSPGSPFSGPLPPDAQVANVGGVITFTSMDAPVGQNFDVSVFCTRYNPVSKTFAKPSFRRVLRLDDYTGEQNIDITGFIEQEFGPIDPNSRIFWCVKTWKTGTPELVGENCGFVEPIADLYIRGNGVLYNARNQRILSPLGTAFGYAPAKAFSISVLCTLQTPFINIDNSGSWIVLTNSSAGPTTSAYLLSYTNTRRLRFWAVAYNNFISIQTSNNVFNFGDSLNIQCVKEAGTGLNSEYSIYLNGVKLVTTNANALAPGTATIFQHVRLGEWGGHPNFPRTMHGILYDAFVCDNYALTPADIAVLNSGLMGSIPVSARWKLDENQGFNAPSVSGMQDGVLSTFFVDTAYGAGTWRNSAGGIAT